MKTLKIRILAALGVFLIGLPMAPPAASGSFEDGEFGDCLGDGAFFCLFGRLPRRVKHEEPRRTDRQADLERVLDSLEDNYSGSAQDYQETLAISQFSVNSWEVSLEFESGAFQGVARSILTLKGEGLFVGMNRDGSDGTQASVLELSADTLAYRYDPQPDVPQAPVFTERFELGTDSLRHETTVADKNGKRLQTRELVLRRIK